MHTKFVLLRRSVLCVLAIVTAGVLLTSCLKNKDDDNSNIPAAGLMAFNLAPDQSAVVVTLNGNVLTPSALAYTSYTGGYQSVYTGSRSIEAFNYQGNYKLTSSSASFEADKYYSLFVVGADSSYRNVVAVDNFDSLSSTSGFAYIRYINAVTDSVNTPTVTIGAGGAEVVSENAAYAHVSGFTAVAPGTLNIAVKNGSGSIDASRAITVEQKKVYTVLLTGVPSSTDDVKKVQIRFISNGTLTDDPAK